MRLVLIFASLVAGALAVEVAPEETPFAKNLRQEVKALNLDPLSLPDLEFKVVGPKDTKVKLTQGKAEGLSEVVAPHGRCYRLFQGADDVKCYVTFNGLRVTYKAQSTQPEKTFDVKVDTAHSLLEVLLRETSDGKTELENVRVVALHQYVREPVEFGDSREETVLFDDALKAALVKELDKVAVTGPFKEALKKAFAQEPFPTKEENVSFYVVE
ncbi:uncharacterized protein LOC135370819 [Ornithodoros turicata]|uniref:uncharacterized protein LOC135370819 n=1 Tax=Ornithodoros turicata TaxID=34597 RepID=UPI003138CBC3